MLPREKLELTGAGSLSDLQLLSVLLGSGFSGCNVRMLAQRVLNMIDSGAEHLKLPDLLTIPGIGLAKGSQIIAALEFSRRRIRPEGEQIKSAQDILPLVSYLSDRKQEHFICISLNGANEVIAVRIVTVGLLNSCQIHPREVFSDPICDRAAAIIVAHNHPSGNLTASQSDLALTKRLIDSSEILGISLLDHVIFGRSGFISLKETSNLF